jgi:hypothetical protein
MTSLSGLMRCHWQRSRIANHGSPVRRCISLWTTDHELFHHSLPATALGRCGACPPHGENLSDFGAAYGADRTR